MLKIRLTRVGKKNSPAFRVVVADHKRAVQRKFIEILGHYNPSTKPKTLVIDKEKALDWISKGAQPSDTVKNLMCDLGILDKKAKVKKVYGKATKKKDAGKEPVAEEKAPTTEGVEIPTESDGTVEAETPIEETAEETPAVEEAPAETETETPVEEK